MLETATVASGSNTEMAAMTEVEQINYIKVLKLALKEVIDQNEAVSLLLYRNYIYS